MYDLKNIKYDENEKTDSSCFVYDRIDCWYTRGIFFETVRFIQMF
jgi:hypothetical protein